MTYLGQHLDSYLYGLTHSETLSCGLALLVAAHPASFGILLALLAFVERLFVPFTQAHDFRVFCFVLNDPG